LQERLKHHKNLGLGALHAKHHVETCHNIIHNKPTCASAVRTIFMILVMEIFKPQIGCDAFAVALLCSLTELLILPSCCLDSLLLHAPCAIAMQHLSSSLVPSRVVHQAVTCRPAAQSLQPPLPGS
jgi:hypothetical protein